MSPSNSNSTDFLSVWLVIALFSCMQWCFDMHPLVLPIGLGRSIAWCQTLYCRSKQLYSSLEGQFRMTAHATTLSQHKNNNKGRGKKEKGEKKHVDVDSNNKSYENWMNQFNPCGYASLTWCKNLGAILCFTACVSPLFHVMMKKHKAINYFNMWNRTEKKKEYCYNNWGKWSPEQLAMN